MLGWDRIKPEPQLGEENQEFFRLPRISVGSDACSVPCAEHCLWSKTFSFRIVLVIPAPLLFCLLVFIRFLRSLFNLAVHLLELYHVCIFIIDIRTSVD